MEKIPYFDIFSIRYKVLVLPAVHFCNFFSQNLCIEMKFTLDKIMWMNEPRFSCILLHLMRMNKIFKCQKIFINALNSNIEKYLIHVATQSMKTIWNKFWNMILKNKGRKTSYVHRLYSNHIMFESLFCFFFHFHFTFIFSPMKCKCAQVENSIFCADFCTNDFSLLSYLW